MKTSNAMRAFLLAMISSAVFYAIVHQPSMRHSVLHTYTTEHATEYAIVILFFWANADLILSFLGNRREHASNRYYWLPAREGIEPVDNAQSLIYHVKAGPMPLHATKMYRRIAAALTYIDQRKSAVGFREYLQDLASRDADETYARYSFPRFVTGVLPILGLLGTVVHFGSALSGLSTEDLASKVPQIVSGMGTAFNTTCAALTASTTTMLFRFLVERQEENVVVQVNEYVEDELLNRFVAGDKQTGQGEALLESVQTLVGSEQQLLVLQARLAENLTLLHRSAHLDEAVHGLTAAIHVLLARQSDAGSSARAA